MKALTLVITIAISLVLALNLLTGCAVSVPSDPLPEATSQQAQLCGVGQPACGATLECFDVCTFECGQKYFQQPDGSFAYGLDQASVDRCTAIGGTCQRYAPDVDINICKVER